MKRIKKIIKTFNIILVCFLFLFCISSCKNHETQNTQQNQKENLYIQKISVNKLIEIIDNQDNFSFIITKSSCDMCENLYSILNNHKDIKIDYEIKLDNTDKNYKKNLKKLKNILPNLMVAPDLNFKKGNKIYRFDSEYSDINYENLSSWIKKYKNND